MQRTSDTNRAATSGSSQGHGANRGSDHGGQHQLKEKGTAQRESIKPSGPADNGAHGRTRSYVSRRGHTKVGQHNPWEVGPMGTIGVGPAESLTSCKAKVDQHWKPTAAGGRAEQPRARIQGGSKGELKCMAAIANAGASHLQLRRDLHPIKRRPGGNGGGALEPDRLPQRGTEWDGPIEWGRTADVDQKQRIASVIARGDCSIYTILSHREQNTGCRTAISRLRGDRPTNQHLTPEQIGPHRSAMTMPIPSTEARAQRGALCIHHDHLLNRATKGDSILHTPTCK
ncbi:unnamed protein product [Calypogeia fissa]